MLGLSVFYEDEKSCMPTMSASTFLYPCVFFLQVFAALGKSSLHVPFRNSMLTQVLQPSLSGDAKVCIYRCISQPVSPGHLALYL